MRIPCASPPPKRRGPPSDAKLPKSTRTAVRIFVYIFFHGPLHDCDIAGQAGPAAPPIGQGPRDRQTFRSEAKKTLTDSSQRVLRGTAKERPDKDITQTMPQYKDMRVPCMFHTSLKTSMFAHKHTYIQTHISLLMIKHLPIYMKV